MIDDRVLSKTFLSSLKIYSSQDIFIQKHEKNIFPSIYHSKHDGSEKTKFL